eukprot:SAG11_NODE_38056_length_254_cov_0.658065_1_plen_33_part_10
MDMPYILCILPGPNGLVRRARGTHAVIGHRRRT